MSQTMTTSVLNFVLAGESRSGLRVCQSALGQHPQIVCHADLFAAKPEVRQQAHTDYFGDDGWYRPELVSSWQYLNHAVFDRPLRGESVVGVCLGYPALAALQLEELLDDRCREGDFCVLHVRRNPVACYVSGLQAERTGVHYLASGARRLRAPVPAPVSVDPEELTTFVRAHFAVRRRVEIACPDRLEVHYRDLFCNPAVTLRRMQQFLEVSTKRLMPLLKRLPNRAFHERVVNWNGLRAIVPTDVRQLMDAEDLL